MSPTTRTRGSPVAQGWAPGGLIEKSRLRCQPIRRCTGQRAGFRRLGWFLRKGL